MARYRDPFGFHFQDMVDEVNEAMNTINTTIATHARTIARDGVFMSSRVMESALSSLDDAIDSHFDNLDQNFTFFDSSPRSTSSRRHYNAERTQSQPPRRHSSRQFQQRNVEDSENESNENFSNSNSEVCAVCLDDMRQQDRKWFLPCAHKFHSRCLRRWLSRNQTCPVCRNQVSLENVIRYL